MSSFLKFIDMSGTPVDFVVNGKKKHKTILGGYLSIVIFIVVCVSFYFASYPRIELIDPIIRTKKVLETVNNTVDLKGEPTLMILYQVRHKDKQIPLPDQKVITPVVELSEYTKNKSGGEKNFTHIEIPFKNCTSIKFYDQFPKYFSENDFLNFRCMDFQDYNNSAVLKGNFDADFFSYLRIEFRMCNKTEDDTCETEDYIRENIGDYDAIVYYFYQIENLQDHENPYIQQMESYNINFVFEQQKRVNIFFTENTIYEDTDLVYDSPRKVVKFYNYDTDRETSGNHYLGKRIFGSYYLRVSQYQYEALRTYKKATSIFSQVGGILFYFHTFLFFFSYFYGNFKVNLKLVNDSYIFETVQTSSGGGAQRGESNTLESSLPEMNSYGNSLQTNHLNLQNSLANENKETMLRVNDQIEDPLEDKLLYDRRNTDETHVYDLNCNSRLSENIEKDNKKRKRYQDKQIELSYFCYLFQKGCCACFASRFKKSRISYLLYTHSLEKLINNLEVSQFLHSNQDFEITKKILFDEDQLDMLHFLNKKTVKYNISNDKVVSIENLERKDLSFEKAKELYYKLNAQSKVNRGSEVLASAFKKQYKKELTNKSHKK